MTIDHGQYMVKGSRTNDEALLFDSLGRDLKGEERVGVVRTFVLQHPSSVIAAHHLYRLIANESIVTDERMQLFGRLDAAVRSSVDGLSCRRLSDKQPLTSVGRPAPYFRSREGSSSPHGL